LLDKASKHTIVVYYRPNNFLEEDVVVKGPANKPDFGRYHHSTQRGSEKIRGKINQWTMTLY